MTPLWLTGPLGHSLRRLHSVQLYLRPPRSSTRLMLSTKTQEHVPMRSPGEKIPRQSALRYLEATVILAVLVPAILFAVEAARRYKDTVDRARARLISDVEVAAQHALRVFDTTDVLLERAFDAVGERDDAAIQSSERALHERLRRITAPLPHIQSMWIFDRKGVPLVSNRFYPTPIFNVSDREYFRWHLAGRGPTFVTEALIARVGGERFFDVSRRRVDIGGSFAGLISVGLHPDHFSSFYKEVIGERQGGRIALFREDGRYVARWPSLPSPETRLPPNGPLVTRWAAGETVGIHDTDSLLDSSERLGAFRKVGTYPLYVYASMPRAEVENAWREEMIVLAAFIAPVSLLLAWIAWVARQRTRDQLSAAQRLELETEQRLRAEDRLRQAQKLEAMGRLTGGVAHDFNNLLAVVSNNAFLLGAKTLGDEARAKALVRIERAVASGTALTRQLLSFTRHQALRPEVLSLQERLPALAEMLHTALGSSILCSVSVAPDTSLVEVDFAELELALLNLAVNAKDASIPGGRVSITARNAAPGERHDVSKSAVVIEFADNGKGIDPALLERVFEPFFTTKPVGEGTGLGLAQVHGFCARANGVAHITSEPGKGTTVLMYLPAVQGKAAPITAAPDAPPPPLMCRVLLVDDNVALAETIKPMLESVGCTVQVAGSVRYALTVLADGPIFDVVLSDIVMPGALDGIHFAESLRHAYPDLPVVLMTGYSAQLATARTQGFTVLPKPCTPQVLVETLSRAVRARPPRPS
ncbi:MAG: hybrid sensor histidine kinase/response regulator [Verrucomicrobiaceae bacterium]|nr:MAG: hybrid sensor histidine kinase/response regulator [Verrucomicrobiaceae bacterium]